MLSDSSPAARGIAASIVCLLCAACAGGSSVTQPTNVDPGAPKIVCPAAPAPVQATDAGGVTMTYDAATASLGAPPVTGPVCNPPSGSKFPVGSTTVTCTVTDAKARADACTFAVVVQAPPPPKLAETRFVAFGDSITYGEDGTSPSTRRFHVAVQLPTPDTYPGALQSDLTARYTTQNPTVTNAGQSGEAVTDSSTFRRFVSYTSSGRYDVVLIMEGANDLADRDSRIVSSVIAGLRRMIDDAKSRGMKPYLATLPPENPSGSRGLAWSLVAPFNEQVQSLAASEDIPLVDVYQAFGGNLSLLSPDGLHPNAEGYHRIADTFMASIRKTLEAAPTPSTPARRTTPPAVRTAATRPAAQRR